MAGTNLTRVSSDGESTAKEHMHRSFKEVLVDVSNKMDCGRKLKPIAAAKREVAMLSWSWTSTITEGVLRSCSIVL